jgi:hypothetical protein
MVEAEVPREPTLLICAGVEDAVNPTDGALPLLHRVCLQVFALLRECLPSELKLWRVKRESEWMRVVRDQCAVCDVLVVVHSALVYVCRACSVC